MFESGFVELTIQLIESKVWIFKPSKSNLCCNNALQKFMSTRSVYYVTFESSCPAENIYHEFNMKNQLKIYIPVDLVAFVLIQNTRLISIVSASAESLVLSSKIKNSMPFYFIYTEIKHYHLLCTSYFLYARTHAQNSTCSFYYKDIKKTKFTHSATDLE